MRDVYEVRTQTAPVHWAVEVPGSKSITNRALLVGALADGEVFLENVLFCDDSRFFIESLQSLGFRVAVRDMEKQVAIQGCGGRIPVFCGEVDAGSAGTAARFLTALLGVSDGTYCIQASPRMQKRPMRPLFEALLSLNARVYWLGEEWHLPVRLSGAGVCRGEGSAQAGVSLDISESTQFLSAFLLIGPMFLGGLKIRITSGKKDGSYIRMTRRMMSSFGVEVKFGDGECVVPPHSAYAGRSYRIEPDVSAACYFYAAAAVTGGYVRVRGVYRNSIQGDVKFLEVLERMGCEVRDEPDGISLTGPAGGALCGLSVDMNDFSDQALTLAAIAPFADSPVRISGIAHVRGQESDRIRGIVSNLRRAGISCEEYEDGVKIFPGLPKGCRIDTKNDHRVAMAFSVMGLRAKGVRIENPMCCGKTFADYFDILDKLTKP